MPEVLNGNFCPDCDVVVFPFSAATDLTHLADCCDRCAETLAECDDAVHKMELLGRLRTCLAVLGPTLLDPIPVRLTAETMLEPQQFFEPDIVALCDYCQTLTLLLCQQTLLPETERTLRGLLCEMVWRFAADLKAPRWERH